MDNLYIILNLEAPLMSFGTTAVDNQRPTGNFPVPSMLTGLLANALGWRSEPTGRSSNGCKTGWSSASCVLRDSPHHMTDFQTAKLSADDVGWTTRGRPEGRAGGRATYDSPHILHRKYLEDSRVRVALRVGTVGAMGDPSLADLENALKYPERPLFIGRKSCIPTTPVFAGYVTADCALSAVLKASLDAEQTDVRVQWRDGEEPAQMDDISLTDRLRVVGERDWITGAHGGHITMCEGWATLPEEEADHE